MGLQVGHDRILPGAISGIHRGCTIGMKMKTATKRAEELKVLFKRLLKDGKPEPLTPQVPLQALVRGAMSFDVPDPAATEAMEMIDKEFVDLNEFRVATDLEIQELLGNKYPSIQRRVEMITRSLNFIFEKEHTLSLDRIKTISKRDARQFLRELPDLHPFVDAYVMLYSLDGAAVPMDDMMADMLRREQIVEEEAPLLEVQRFVEHHLKSEECYDFYICLRRAAQTEPADASRKKAKVR